MTDAQQYAAMDPYGAMAPGGDSNFRTKGAWRHWKVLPRVWPYLRRYRTLYVVVFLFMLLGSAMTLAQPWPLALMVDGVFNQKGLPSVLVPFFGKHPDRYMFLVVVVIAGFMITVIGHGLEVLNSYLTAKIEQNMILDLRSDLFRHCQRLSLTFHDERATGQLMGMINMQASAVGGVVMAFPPLLQNALTLIGMLVIALMIDWQVTLISMSAVPFIYYALGLYGSRIVPRVQRVMGLEWGSLSIVYEAMSMLRVIVSFGREKHEHRRFRSQGKTAVDARVHLTVLQTLFTLGVTAATAAGTSLVLGFGAWHVIRGEIGVGELIVLISYVGSVYRPLEQIGTSVGELHQQMVFLNATFSLLDEEPEITEIVGAADIGRSTGQLTVENLSFAYKHRDETIKDVSFDVKAAQRVAIVGPTGAGKTTLVNLILRFYDAKAGRILIDGTDVRALTLSSLRDQFSVVLQEPLLFSGTIAENIRYGMLEATSEEIIQAAKRANAHDFIMGLPKGYETELGEGGRQLSGGERQRICVARAFIRDAPILILDEPTSSIDSKTEDVILAALDELMVGRTSIMIAHRLSTIRHADLILVMNHGKLVERGTHDELLAIGGLYAQLYQAQTRIRSRMRTEGGAGYEGQLIDTISQEVAERVYASVGNGSGVVDAPDGDGFLAEEIPTEARPTVPSGSTRPVNVHRNAAQSAEADGEGQRAQPGRSQAVVRILGESKDVRCGFCGRTLLKGEHAEAFVAPVISQRRRRGNSYNAEMDDDTLLSLRRMQGKEREQKLVCELCWSPAEQAGWAPLPVVGGHR